jgi:NADH dehydrogenase
MSHAPKLVTIFGGSGFVGRYIARRMAKEGWRVRVAVRRPNEAIFVKPYGTVGQVEPILANIRNDASVEAACAGADAVVNCVGTFDKGGKNSFDAVQIEGAERVARIAKASGVGRLVHISAIGADVDAESQYAQTKGKGESLVKAAFPRAVILRPSVIFGSEDQFFNRFANMAKISPIIPVVGGNSKFQPVYVDDVAKAAVMGVLGKAGAGTYELGGPEVDTFSNLLDRMLACIRRRRFKLHVPFFVASIQAKLLDIAFAMTLGLFKNTLLTADQVKQLRHDNVVGTSAKGFAKLGIEPTSMDAVLDGYLYCHRPYGQYAELTESGKNMSA